MSGWQRPYTVPSEIVFRQLAAAAVVVATLGFVIAFAAQGRIDDVRTGVAAAVGAITAGYALRMRVVGVFMNDRGVLVRTFDSTTEVPWRSVAWIDMLPSTDQTAPDGPMVALWISTVDGEQIETPLLRRRAGTMVASAVSAYLPCADFDQAFRELRATQARCDLREQLVSRQVPGEEP